MFAAVRMLPKYLLAILAFGIISGHFYQLECKLVGCEQVAGSHACDDGQAGDKAPGKSGDSHCSCQCHFNLLAPVEPLKSYAVFLHLWSDYSIVRIEHAPESPCADIEHPPQLA